MKRVLIIGCPGSGKSTFARALHMKTGLPLYHMDMLYWNADKTAVPHDVFDACLDRILHADAWILDGNYNRTMEMRFAACDTVFFLDYATDVCLSGIAERRGKVRTDMPWFEEKEDAEFTSFVRNFNSDCRPTILKLLETHPDLQQFVFHTRDEADAYLQ